MTNLLAAQHCRVALLVIATVALHGSFVIEQPQSSLLFKHERMQWVLSQLEAGGFFNLLFLFTALHVFQEDNLCIHPVLSL